MPHLSLKYGLIKIGQFYKLMGTDEIYLLANVDLFKVALINLKGERWTDPTEVKDIFNISQDEWKCISTSQNEGFIKFNAEIIIS